MSTQNEIQRLAHELEKAQGDDPSIDWDHPAYIAYEDALDASWSIKDLPLVPYLEAKREHEETRQQYQYQIEQYRKGYGNLRRIADTGGRWTRTYFILDKSRSHWPKEDPDELPPKPHPSAIKARADKYVHDHYVVVNGKLYPKRKKS